MLKKFLLDNGIRVVCERIPYSKSTAIGIWVKVGSKDDGATSFGVSHFIEHMLFKGTFTRTAKDIAECIDNIGGVINAFTSKESTCFSTKVRDKHIEIAIELLSDMFFNSTLSEKDIYTEKKVIMEEIRMYQDSPEDLVHDLLFETVWEGNSLGYPVLGTEESLNSINRDKLLEHMRNNYIPENIVISVAGNYDHQELNSLLNKYFGNWISNYRAKQQNNQVNFCSRINMREKDTEQMHVCMGFRGLELGNKISYPLIVINNILGGSMSSRLFQKIREEKGYVYSIYSYPSFFSTTGLFTIYAGMNPEYCGPVMQLVLEEIDRLLKIGITEDELERAKQQIEGNYVLGLESVGGRMTSIGKAELIIGKVLSYREIINRIEKITLNDIRNVIDQVLNTNEVSFSVVGNAEAISKFEIKQSII